EVREQQGSPAFRLEHARERDADRLTIAHLVDERGDAGDHRLRALLGAGLDDARLDDLVAVDERELDPRAADVDPESPHGSRLAATPRLGQAACEPSRG